MEYDILLWMSKFYYWFSIFIFYYSLVNYEYNNCALTYLLIGFLTNRFHMRQYLNSVGSKWSHIMLNTYLLITVQVYRLHVEKNCNFSLVDTILFVHVTICTPPCQSFLVIKWVTWKIRQVFDSQINYHSSSAAFCAEYFHVDTSTSQRKCVTVFKVFYEKSISQLRYWKKEKRLITY